MTDVRDDQATDRWIDDYRAVGPIEWPEELRTKLRKLKRRATLRMILWGLPVLPVGLLGILVLGAAVESRHQTESVVMFIIAGALILSVVIAILRANDWQKKRINARAALKHDQLERFDRGEHIAEEIAAAKAMGQDVSLDGFPDFLIIAPRASLALQTADRILEAPVPVEIRELARVQAAPRIDTRESRSLNGVERDELRRTLKGLRRAAVIHWCIYAFLTVTLACGVYALIGSGIPAGDRFFFVMITVMWLVMTLRIFGPVRQRRETVARLRRDLADGELERIDGADAAAELRESGELPDDFGVNPTVVWRLQHSEIWWEIDGVPAAWRRV